MLSSRRRSLLVTVIRIIAHPPVGVCVTITRNSNDIYPASQTRHGKKTFGNLRQVSHNPGPSRTRQYYNKGGNKSKARR